MKATLLTLLAAITLTLTGCVVPSDGSYSYSRPSSFSYSYNNYNRPYSQSHRTYSVGPQYYRTQDHGCYPTRYKNYSNAPVVVERPYGSNIIVPRSWN
jgi:hypothetical protein